MVIIRKKKFSGYSDANLNGYSYFNSQLDNTIDKSVDLAKRIPDIVKKNKRVNDKINRAKFTINLIKERFSKESNK